MFGGSRKSHGGTGSGGGVGIVERMSVLVLVVVVGSGSSSIYSSAISGTVTDTNSTNVGLVQCTNLYVVSYCLSRDVLIATCLATGHVLYTQRRIYAEIKPIFTSGSATSPNT